MADKPTPIYDESKIQTLSIAGSILRLAFNQICGSFKAAWLKQ
jgi:hypothetical protein